MSLLGQTHTCGGVRPVNRIKPSPLDKLGSQTFGCINIIIWYYHGEQFVDEKPTFTLKYKYCTGILEFPARPDRILPDWQWNNVRKNLLSLYSCFLTRDAFSHFQVYIIDWLIDWLLLNANFSSISAISWRSSVLNRSSAICMQNVECRI